MESPLGECNARLSFLPSVPYQRHQQHGVKVAQAPQSPLEIVSRLELRPPPKPRLGLGGSNSMDKEGLP